MSKATTSLAIALLVHNANSQCTTSGTISTFSGKECNRALFEANLVDGCTVADLFDTTTVDADTQIADLCKYDAPVQFVEINGYYQLDKRYFNGGGPLIDSAEPFGVEAGRILRFDANSGGNTLIGWPEYAALVGYNAQELSTEENPELGDHGYPPNFDIVNSCDLNTVMCCFIDDVADTGFAAEDSTTDVCRHDLLNSPKANHIKDGWSVFPNAETSTHCVGFTWEDGADSDLFKGNALYDISLRNTANKGYIKSIPGAPLCGCIEQMPIVEKADCRTATGGDITFTFTHDAETGEVTASNVVDVTYADCAEADLAAHIKATHPTFADAIDMHLVGDGGCAADLTTYLNDEQFLVAGTHATKYKSITEADGWKFVAGEGIRFLPPKIDAEAADAEFRALINAGCKDDGDVDRPCLIRRFCDSCSSETHRDIYYKRLTPIPEFGEAEGQVYFLDLFLNNWNSQPANVLNTDFELYSTYEDAIAGTNGWKKCNYNDAGVGFPRDCGPEWNIGSQWNSYIRDGASANNHGFYVELPSTA
ncbi:predicted protein [Thalassiosira pseudonana CCMP1335]|jgi:hypothetical protein|uniref:Uncharacterized protein n=1 Tax=Thalassiosira pseudonana TaxID=35128 RepID=B8CGA9_THAPS|nr:predicted protein [Thalassiosira pseudonana CCMP1335]EED87460.1 predicted protein [Thalassiosira pseudonana CCMP1335]